MACPRVPLPPVSQQGLPEPTLSPGSGPPSRRRRGREVSAEMVAVQDPPDNVTGHI